MLRIRSTEEPLSQPISWWDKCFALAMGNAQEGRVESYIL